MDQDRMDNIISKLFKFMYENNIPDDIFITPQQLIDFESNFPEDIKSFYKIYTNCNGKYRN